MLELPWRVVGTDEGTTLDSVLLNVVDAAAVEDGVTL